MMWYAVALALAVLYAWRAQALIVSRQQLDWRAGLLVSCSIVVGTLLAHRFNLDVLGSVHYVLLCGGIWCALYFWSSWIVLRLSTLLLAITLVLASLVDHAAWSNTLMVLTALAFVPGAFYVSRGWACIVYVLFACLDAYAVWSSDIMDRIVARSLASPIPGGFVLTQSVPDMLRPSFEHMPRTLVVIQQQAVWIVASLKSIDALDIVMACFAIALAVRFGGIRAGILTAAAIQASLILLGLVIMFGGLGVMQIPFLVMLTPIVVTMLCCTRQKNTA